MVEPLPATLTAARAALEAGELTAVDLVDACVAVADAHDARLGVFLTTTFDTAREAAARSDERRAAGAALGPLDGVPLVIKDIVLTEDAPTTGQSLLRDRVATGDATVSARLRASGAPLLGKTSTMEFALGFPDAGGPFPLPRNPWDDTRWSGGSSSGTASAVAAGMALGGVGTDTAGSIRMPAAWCGITGHMPTYGLVPRTGVFPMAWSLDHVGPLARTAEDCALLLAAMAGPDGVDDTVPPDVAFAPPSGPADLAGLRVGVALDPLERSVPGVRDRVAEAVDVLARAGADVREVRLPHYTEGEDATMLGVAAESLAYHHREATTRWSEFGAVTRAAFLAGLLVTGADLMQSFRVRRHLQDELTAVFADHDVVVGPTGAGPAPFADHMDFDELVALLQTKYWNATGHPALSVPMGLVDGLPVGLQIAGRAFDDARVLAVGGAFQALTDHHLARPDLEVTP